MTAPTFADRPLKVHYWWDTKGEVFLNGAKGKPANTICRHNTPVELSTTEKVRVTCLPCLRRMAKEGLGPPPPPRGAVQFLSGFMASDDDRVVCAGKEVLLDGKHFADCVTEEGAQAIAIAMTYIGLPGALIPAQRRALIERFFE